MEPSNCGHHVVQNQRSHRWTSPCSHLPESPRGTPTTHSNVPLYYWISPWSHGKRSVVPETSAPHRMRFWRQSASICVTTTGLSWLIKLDNLTDRSSTSPPTIISGPFTHGTLECHPPSRTAMSFSHPDSTTTLPRTTDRTTSSSMHANATSAWQPNRFTCRQLGTSPTSSPWYAPPLK